MNVAIIGGTGTLGQALAKKLLERGDRVSIFSRCELKQAEMAKQLQGQKIDFTIGDIRDKESVRRFIRTGCFTFVYHVAALKHVDLLEKNPEEAVYTDIIGTINVADACEEFKVVNCAFSSTDKAVDPINAYGMCKGVSERILYARNLRGGITRYSVFRWGNVIGSRGSAIPYFIKAMRLGQSIPVTDHEMTRYWIKIEDAADFMISKQATWNRSEAEVPEMKSARVCDILDAIAKNLGIATYSTRTIGNRGGEKMHESLRSQFGPGHINSYTSSRYTVDELAEMIAPLCGGVS